jgi:molecular chaperone DnaK (HSP70)
MTSSVIGLDVGSWTSYVAKVENGGVVLLTNELNSRSTPTIIALPSSETGTRYYYKLLQIQTIFFITNLTITFSTNHKAMNYVTVN